MPVRGLKSMTQKSTYIFFELKWIYGYQNDRDDSPSYQINVEHDQMKNERAISKNVPAHYFWQK